MTREAKDLVSTISEKTNRHIIRILHCSGPLRGSEIEKRLKETAKIRFKSTSTISETMARLQEKNLVQRKDSLYFLADKTKVKWVVKFLNLLVEEKIDRGEIIKSKM